MEALRPSPSGKRNHEGASLLSAPASHRHLGRGGSSPTQTNKQTHTQTNKQTNGVAVPGSPARRRLKRGRPGPGSSSPVAPMRLDGGSPTPAALPDAAKPIRVNASESSSGPLVATLRRATAAPRRQRPRWRHPRRDPVLPPTASRGLALGFLFNFIFANHTTF